MATPNDEAIASDIYGGRLRLNPNESSRSYGTRLFRVRLDPDWTAADAASGDGDVWYDEDEEEGIDPGKMRRAIYAAVGVSPTGYPDLEGLILQDVNARQVGPHDYEVQADYFKTETGGLRGTAKSVNVSTRQASVPVYRTLYNDAGDVQLNTTSGLPAGNFAGLGDDQQLPRGASYESWKYEYPVTEALVQISAELNVTTYAALFTSTGALGYINYYNNSPYTYGEITFGTGTLKFLGLSTQSQIVGGERSYNVTYTYLWRPGGWYAQKLTTSGAVAGFFKTVDRLPL